jgi:hypothetical protein
MRYINRSSLGLAALTAIIALGFWFTAGISGEVFLVSPEGKPELAPGTEVRIYRCDDKHSLQAFLATLDILQSRKEIEARFRPLGSQAAMPDDLWQKLLDSRTREIDFGLHMQIFTIISRYWQPEVARTTTDRYGQFSVRLTPGKYLIHVWGQAGKSKAHWLREAQVTWRSETRLSTPIYSYEPE